DVIVQIVSERSLNDCLVRLAGAGVPFEDDALRAARRTDDVDERRVGIPPGPQSAEDRRIANDDRKTFVERERARERGVVEDDRDPRAVVGSEARMLGVEVPVIVHPPYREIVRVLRELRYAFHISEEERPGQIGEYRLRRAGSERDRRL